MTDTDHVLVVDDEAFIVIGLRHILQKLGHRVCGTAATAEKAIELALQHRPWLILMDVRLKGMRDGVDAARTIREHHPCSIIFITGSNEPETRQRVIEAKPNGFLIKPIGPDDLKEAIQSLPPLADVAG